MAFGSRVGPDLVNIIPSLSAEVIGCRKYCWRSYAIKVAFAARSESKNELMKLSRRVMHLSGTRRSIVKIYIMKKKIITLLESSFKRKV